MNIDKLIEDINDEELIIIKIDELIIIGKDNDIYEFYMKYNSDDENDYFNFINEFSIN